MNKEDYFKAAFDGDSGKVGQLLAASPDLLNEREERQSNFLGPGKWFPLGQATALIYAAMAGNATCLKLLLEKGPDLNVVDEDKATALMWAAYWGYDECTKSLLEAGADKDMRDNSGETALMKAASRGYTECIKVLLQGGAGINLTDSSNRTALHLAASRGYTECIKVLLQGGAGINLTDSSNRTALHLAELKGHTSIAQKIRETSASAEQRSCTWLTIQMNALRELNVHLQQDLEAERNLTASLRQQLIDRDTEVMESCKQNEQKIFTCEHELRAEILECKNKCLQSSIEKQQLMEELCQVMETCKQKEQKLMEELCQVMETCKQKEQKLMEELCQDKKKADEYLRKNINLESTILHLINEKQQKFEELCQVKKQCSEQEQVIGALQNDVASSNRKQIQLNKSVEQLQEKLLVSKNEFLETSNKNIDLEITITELQKENQLMKEELCQTDLHNLSKERLMELETLTIASTAKLQETLKKKLEAEEEQMMCCICMQHKKAMIFLPCGHICVCGNENCSGSTLENCPLDNLRIEDRKKVFI